MLKNLFGFYIFVLCKAGIGAGVAALAVGGAFTAYHFISQKAKEENMPRALTQYFRWYSIQLYVEYSKLHYITY